MQGKELKPGLEPPDRKGNRSSRHKGIGKSFWVLVGVLTLCFILFLSWEQAGVWQSMSPDLLWQKLGKPLSRTLVFVSAGLLVGQFIEGLGWTSRLGILAWPLIKCAHLPKEAGAAFTTAFASGVAANALLYTSWQEGKLNGKQLVLANILTASLPAYFLHLPTTFFVVYALLGEVAVLYFSLTLAAAILRTIAVVLVSRLISEEAKIDPARPPARSKPWKQILHETWDKFLIRLQRMLLIIVPVYAVVFLLAQAGFFTWLSQSLAQWISTDIIPVEAMSVVIFAVVAEFTSGFAAAGALLQSGALAVKEVVVALLIGNIIATPVRALRHQLPHYMGIYSASMGLRLLAAGQGARVTSVIIVMCLFIWGF